MSFVMAFLLAVAPAPASDVPSNTPAPPPAAADPDQKVRCKSETVTGTLVGRRRVCHTVAEWRQITGNATDEAQKLIDRGTLQPTNGGG